MPKRKRISPKTMAAAVRYAKRKRYARSSTAKKALTMAKQVKKMVYKTIEKKTVDYSAVSQSVSTGGFFISNMFKTQQGDEDGGSSNPNARTGNSVTLMKEKFYLTLRGPGTTGVNESNNIIRVLIVESTEGNQTMSLSDVLKYSNQTTHGHLVFNSPYQTKTSTNHRYKVHYDKVVKMNYYSSSHYQTLNCVINHGKTGRVVNFNDNQSTPTDYNLTMWVISDSAAAQHPILDFAYRGVFRDS